MKNKFITIPLLFIMIAVLFSACSTSSLTSGQSWPGLTADSEAGAVYLANGSKIYAVDADSGSLIWSYPEKPSNRQTFYAKPAIAGDQLIIADLKDSVIGLDIESGNEKWVFDGADDRFIGGAVFANDTIFAPSADYNVYALDLYGKEQFRMETKQFNWSTPVVDGDVLYLTSMDHYLYAFDTTNGDLIWKIDMGGPMNGSPALAENVLYVGTINKEIIAVSAQTGKFIWRTPVDSYVWASPVVVDDMVLVGDESGKVYSLDIENGKMNWTAEVGSSITASVTVLGENIVVVSHDRVVIAFNFDGGKEWTRTVPDSAGTLCSNPVVINDLMIIPLTQGSESMLAAFDSNGNQTWTFMPQN